MSNLIQIPLSDGSFLQVDVSQGSVVRSSQSRVGVPRVQVQYAKSTASVPGGAVVEAILDVNADNLENNTVEVTGPAIAQSLDDKLVFLPDGADYNGVSHGWVVLGDSGALDAHAARSDNPHAVTKAQVGLGDADNTADADKPVSTAVATALGLKADLADVILDAPQLDANAGSLAGNTVVVTGPAIALTLDSRIAYLPAGGDYQGVNHDWVVAGGDSDASAHIVRSDNPHTVTKAQVGLGSADNTADVNKPVSTAQQAALNDKADQTALDAHEADTANPHAVTKSQVGLANADNTSDAAKPVSTAQQSALDLKANQTALDTHEGDTTNPHMVTKSQVGLGDADNTSDADKPASNAVLLLLGDKADQSSLDAHEANTANPHAVTKAQVGLGNADNTSDAAKPVSTAQQDALDLKADVASAMKEAAKLDANHDNLDGNTVAVTGPAFAFSLDDYLCYLPSGGAYQGVSHDWEVLSFNAPVATHIARTDNPHTVTKAQVGLGSADNTADVNKPVSTAQQAALDDKQDLVTAASPTEVTNGTITSVRLLTPADLKSAAIEHGGGIHGPAELSVAAALDKIPVLDTSDGDVIKYVRYDTISGNGLVELDAPFSTVNSANTVSASGPVLGVTNDGVLVFKAFGTGTDGWQGISVIDGGSA